MRIFEIVLFCVLALGFVACQSDQAAKEEGQQSERSKQDGNEDRKPANLQIINAEFDQDGFSEYLGHIIGRNTRYHTVEAPKGTELEIEFKADLAGTKIVVIKPRGGFLWEEVVSNPDEPLSWSDSLPVDGKYTVEITLTGKPKRQEAASQYTLRMQK